MVFLKLYNSTILFLDFSVLIILFKLVLFFYFYYYYKIKGRKTIYKYLFIYTKQTSRIELIKVVDLPRRIIYTLKKNYSTINNVFKNK